MFSPDSELSSIHFETLASQENILRPTKRQPCMNFEVETVLLHTEYKKWPQNCNVIL